VYQMNRKRELISGFAPIPGKIDYPRLEKIAQYRRVILDWLIAAGQVLFSQVVTAIREAEEKFKRVINMEVFFEAWTASVCIFQKTSLGI